MAKQKNLTAKRKRLTAKFLWCREDIFYSLFVCREVIFLARVFFFFPWGFSCCPEVSFCPEVNSFPLTVGWATLPLKFCSQRFLIFSTCGYSWELPQTLLIWLVFIILAIEFVDWPIEWMNENFINVSMLLYLAKTKN